MHMQRKLVVLVGCVLVMNACKGGSSPSGGGASEPTEVTTPKAAPVANLVASTAVKPGKYYLNERSSLYLTPSAEAFVPDPFPEHAGKTTNNWVGDAWRGAEMTVTEVKDGWCLTKREKAGNATGWVQCHKLLPMDSARLVTVVEDVPTYDPNNGAAQREQLDAGTLLLALESRGGFTKVNVKGSTHAWVKSDVLTEDPQEMAVAKLIQRARHGLEADTHEDFRGILDKARKHLPDAKLTAVLVRHTPVTDVNKGKPVVPTSPPND